MHYNSYGSGGGRGGFPGVVICSGSWLRPRTGEQVSEEELNKTLTEGEQKVFTMLNKAGKWQCFSNNDFPQSWVCLSSCLLHLHSLTLSCTGDGLVMIDEKAIITIVNDRLCEMSGWTREELVGNNVKVPLCI